MRYSQTACASVHMETCRTVRASAAPRMRLTILSRAVTAPRITPFGWELREAVALSTPSGWATTPVEDVFATLATLGMAKFARQVCACCKQTCHFRRFIYIHPSSTTLACTCPDTSLVSPSWTERRPSASLTPLAMVTSSFTV
jgi:hypothetical protein